MPQRVTLVILVEMPGKVLKYLFFTALLIELAGEYIVTSGGSPNIIYASKPLLMPLLMAYYISRRSKLEKYDYLILSALLFSLAGDVLLMVTWTGRDLFVFGLAAFLVAHVFYISAFRSEMGAARTLLKEQPVLALGVILYGMVLLGLLNRTGGPSFAEYQLPVVLYAIIILGMLLTALNRKNEVDHDSFRLVAAGAAIFILSDSIIAVNKFTDLFSSLPLFPRLAIMATYGIGQYLIIEGCLVQRRTQS